MPNYIVCDMDDCLIKTDALFEQWLILFKQNPVQFFASFFWLLKGKNYFKQKLCSSTVFTAPLIPIRAEVVETILARKKEGNAVAILASASPQPWVQAIAATQAGLFDIVIGSDDSRNLKGTEKLRGIQEILGNNNFTYIGDHAADLSIWKEASEIIAVNPNGLLKFKIEALKKPTTFIVDKKRSLWFLLLKQVRPHQWVKNLLIFLPVITGHKLFSSPDYFFQCFAAFAGFSFSASFVYVFNDLLDIPSDRNHHSKKNRPLASGSLSIKLGVILLPILLLLTIGFSLLVPTAFSYWILAYLCLNMAYSFYLKQTIVVDIIVLSMMYTLRIFAGSAAASVPVSEWLLSFSTLFFFSLACVKRYTEIIRSKNKTVIDGRGYQQLDHPMIQSLGVGSGLLSIVIILLYLQSNDVRVLYTKPQVLWFITPILLFWISRVWILANRNQVHDDPVLFAVKDVASWFCLVALAVVFGAAL